MGDNEGEDDVENDDDKDHSDYDDDNDNVSKSHLTVICHPHGAY